MIALWPLHHFFVKFGEKATHGPSKKHLDVVGNPVHVTLALGTWLVGDTVTISRDYNN